MHCDEALVSIKDSIDKLINLTELFKFQEHRPISSVCKLFSTEVKLSVNKLALTSSEF